MIIFIKENEIITEYNYNEETIQELIEKGFQEIEVPHKNEEYMYRYEDFEKINDLYILKENNQ